MKYRWLYQKSYVVIGDRDSNVYLHCSLSLILSITLRVWIFIYCSGRWNRLVYRILRKDEYRPTKTYEEIVTVHSAQSKSQNSFTFRKLCFTQTPRSTPRLYLPLSLSLSSYSTSIDTKRLSTFYGFYPFDLVPFYTLRAHFLLSFFELYFSTFPYIHTSMLEAYKHTWTHAFVEIYILTHW